MFNVVAFHTDDPLYSLHADLLKASLVRFNIDPHIEKIPAKSWQQSVAFKPEFLNRMLHTYDVPILYIDADAFVHQDFSFFFNTIDADFACHYFNNKELLSGTLYFNNTKKAKALVQDWLAQQKKNPQVWDQKVLQASVESGLTFSLSKLDTRFCKIYDQIDGVKHEETSRVMIEHLQASREAKFRQNLERGSALRRRYKTRSFLNPNYRKILQRRAYTLALANSIDLPMNFPDFQIEK